ncbi:MAG TPA: DUF6596 domain-containing protein [Lichenihabitans sp.]|jgi:RNA polymerase sigma-70 factor (ECF subfamily)|nr:DUF6596 domain-containing protein [Lichenihabitans sp.]
MTTGDQLDVLRAADGVARDRYGKLIAILAAETRDLSAAEDALSDAFTGALVRWHKEGVPRSPEAWLLSVARRRLVDRIRHARVVEGAAGHLRLAADERADAACDEDEQIPDWRLRLMFVCAHPAIDRKVRAPLMLQTVMGLDTASIAGAFLVSPHTMTQRLVRAKRKIKLAGISFEPPDGSEVAARLDAVLDAIYAVFMQGWTDPLGGDPRRRGLAHEALWLGALAVKLAPQEPEALGLMALMLHLDARSEARRNASGDYVPLAEQDTALWDPEMIAEAEDLLGRAAGRGRIGRFQLEAAIQSAHADRRRGNATDWPAIENLYDHLHRLTGSPVVAINRAIASAERLGPEAGLRALDAIAADPRLSGYQPFWAGKAELLSKMGDQPAAAAAFDQAIALETDGAVRDYLARRRAQACQAGDGSNASLTGSS